MQNEIARDSINIEKRENDIDIFQLWFGAKPPAKDPNHAKG